jgi:hypothetical protein
MVKSIAHTLIVLAAPLWIPVGILGIAYAKFRPLFPRRKRKFPPAILKQLQKPIDPELAHRRALGVRDEHGFGLIDPVCLEPELAWAFREARQQAEEEVGEPYKRGDCHRIWRIMKKILREDFDIVWFTPAEMNPSSRYL